MPAPITELTTRTTAAGPAFESRDQAAVGDGDAVGVAGQVGQHLLGSSERTFGVDEPVRLPVRRKMGLEGPPVGKMLVIAEELQTAGGVRVDQHSQHAPAEQGREHLDGHEIVGP